MTFGYPAVAVWAHTPCRLRPRVLHARTAADSGTQSLGRVLRRVNEPDRALYKQAAGDMIGSWHNRLNS